MKKLYIEPNIYLTEYMSSLMDNIGVGSNPDDGGDILGKDRKDDLEGGGTEEGRNWTDGLW